jgi:glycolate oxidase
MRKRRSFPLRLGCGGVGMGIVELKRTLENIVGTGNVSNEDFELVCYSRGWTADIPRDHQIIAKPRTVEQISEILRTANEMKVPVVPLGGQSNLIGHPEGVLCLDLTGMNKMVEVDEGSLTATAETGMTWEEFLYELSKKGWTAGPHLHSAPTATLGGSVALCSNGPTSAKYGLVGHQVVGLEAVLPNGEIVRTGSGANPKAKIFIRYGFGSDLTGLFIGSHGIYGVITKVTFRIFEKPEATEMQAYTFNSLETACRALYSIQKKAIPIESAYIMMGFYLQYTYPEIRAPFAIAPIIIAGSGEEVNLHGKRVREACLGEGQEVSDPKTMGKVREWWKYDFAGQYKAPPPMVMMPVPLCSCVPTLDVPKVYDAYVKFSIQELAKTKTLTLAQAFACQNNTVFTPLIMYDERDPETWRRVREFIPKVVNTLAEFGFTPHYTGRLKGPPELMQRLGGYYGLLKELKQKIDPNNILNPGYLTTLDA